MKVAVAYLARGGPGAADSVRAFLDSYKDMPADYAHDLFVMVKGWPTSERDELARLLSCVDHAVIELPDDGFDWGAYIRTARTLDHEWLVFFNTHSGIQSAGWLRKMMAAASDTIGVVSATASWGSIYNPLMSAWPAVVFTYRNRGLFKAFVGGMLRVLQFPLHAIPARIFFAAPPNPHVRSNGFLVRRKLFCEFADSVEIPQTKFAAHRLESGRRNMTRFVMARGMEPVVVGADGRVFRIPEWPESRTFQNPDQSNLLISDNQTRLYAGSSDEIRRSMEKSAWCRVITSPPPQ